MNTPIDEAENFHGFAVACDAVHVHFVAFG
jgi:hypothetical protein